MEKRMDHQTHYLIAGNGYWGRGATEHEAVTNAQYLRKGDKVMMARCHPDTRITEDGLVAYPRGLPPTDWTHGTITGNRTAYKFNPKA